MPFITTGNLARPSGLISSESVSDGHPDKICDQISDAVLDAALARNPNARVAVEAAAKGREVWVFGEISGACAADLDIEAIVRSVYRDIGHTDRRWGLASDQLTIRVSISEQSRPIGDGVDRNPSGELGAGDQGLMFGYADSSTASLLPLPIDLAHQLMRAQKDARQRFPVLGPDAKSQVTVDLSAGSFRNVTAVVLSSQHAADASLRDVRELIHAEILAPVLADRLAPGAQILINPSGPFVDGGPVADAGLTGRKIIVDTYGGFARHGGGAFSGKDATKVDRSAAYAARQLAKAVVDFGLAGACEVRVAYAIGEPRPVALHIDVDGPAGALTALRQGDLLEAMKPGAIITRLDLRRPIYRPTSTFGHFGSHHYPWESACQSLKAIVGDWARAESALPRLHA
jgi:S-adenosylmethionine synthetase